MGKYLQLQNKALHQGMYLAYVSLPHTPVVFTTNGHVIVRGKVHEVKPIKTQDDRRDDKNVIALIDKRWLEDIKQAKPVVITPDGEVIKADGHEYQLLYVKYIMARYPVSEWKMGGSKLIAVDETNHVIAVIAPMKEKEVNE